MTDEFLAWNPEDEHTVYEVELRKSLQQILDEKDIMLATFDAYCELIEEMLELMSGFQPQAKQQVKIYNTVLLDFKNRYENIYSAWMLGVSNPNSKEKH